MKFTVFLSGFLLLFLFPDWSESVDTVDINTLARIINYFEENYKIRDRNGDSRQYAVAINVPEDQCQQNFNPTQNNFLTRENAVNVRNAITSLRNGLYRGKQLIAAGLRRVIEVNREYNLHSEFLLLRRTGNSPISPMTSLLNRRNNGCSVFFTFNSPCVRSCLNRTRYQNILGALSEWSRHSGIKAFVFKDIWWRDHQDFRPTELETAFRQIAAFIPVFRCVTDTRCYACRGEGNSPINPDCLRSPEI